MWLSSERASEIRRVREFEGNGRCTAPRAEQIVIPEGSYPIQEITIAGGQQRLPERRGILHEQPDRLKVDIGNICEKSFLQYKPDE